jgi:prolyl-tRNA synthetase
MTQKYRDEMNPRFGMLRAREFLMKDLYTFDANSDDARQTYECVRQAYDTLMTLLELPVIRVRVRIPLRGLVFTDIGNVGFYGR